MELGVCVCYLDLGMTMVTVADEVHFYLEESVKEKA